MTTYPKQVEKQMQQFYASLSEKDKRGYAAIESLKLGRGGKSYICELFNCHFYTLKKGLNELLNEKKPYQLQDRIRNQGGGRKNKIETKPALSKAFLAILQENTAGSPMDENIKWTNLSRYKIAELLEKKGFKVSITVVKKLLEKHGFKKRKPFKSIAGGNHKDRNKQFDNIDKLKTAYNDKGNPVISMDVKKKELIGNFSRGDDLYTQERVHVNDHDFKSQAEGIAIPHGIYDINRNTAYITIGTSKDTSEFACDSIVAWWENEGKRVYPNATSILILCDGGGSNSSRYYIFKEKLQEAVNKIGIEIRIAHYPPYTSKYNPIEHRLFPHVTRACKGLIFKTINIVKEAIKQTSTKTGLKVFASISNKIYHTGKKVTDGFKENMKIIFDAILPRWNYCTVPQIEG